MKLIFIKKKRMSKKIINEIQSFRKLSGVIKEDYNNYSDLFTDLKKLVTIASSDLKKTEEYQNLISFFKDLLPPGFDIESDPVPSEKDFSKTVSDKVPSTVTNDDDFYKEILECLGAPVTKDNMLFFYAWRQSEGGQATNNPFNTTKKMDGASLYGKNVAGVKNYPTIDDGIKATCETLKLGYYTDIVDGLKNDVGLYELSRMSSINTWGTGELLAKVADGYLSGSTPKPKPIMKGDFSKGETTS
jgi:hypothetical protein